MLGGGVLRVIALVVIVLATGAAAGLAVGYPLTGLEFGSDDAVVLDQSALTGIDLAEALAQPDDLPSSFAVSEEFSATVNLVGAEFCGSSVSLDATANARASKAYIDDTNNAFFVSEAVRAKDTTSATRYVQQLTSLLDGCEKGRYFKVEGDERIEVEITSPRRNPPLKLDYVTRTISPTKGGPVQVVSYFQVGNVVVALQYAGPEKAYESLMETVETKILSRLVPEQFGETVPIEGEEPLPTDTTIQPNAVDPSPTSSVDYTDESMPPATFDPPKTTTTAKSKD